MSAKQQNNLSIAAAAKALGTTDDFILSLTLCGAKPPSEGATIELDYEMDGNEVTFTTKGIERFLKQCPLGELVPSAKAAEQLGVARTQISLLRFTGVPTAGGGVVKLPVWQLGGREYVRQGDLEAFAVHHKGAVERRAAREHAKKYANRGRKKVEKA